MTLPLRVLPALVELRLALFCAFVHLLVGRTSAQSHFSSSGQPNLQRWNTNLQGQQLPHWQPDPQLQQPRFNGGSHSPLAGGASHMNRPSPPGGSTGSAVVGGNYGTGNTDTNAWASSQVGARGEPEHLQLLGLSAELTRQARFGEAKAALAAAAQLTGGGLEIIGQAEVLRWRMGLRQVTAAEIHEWLGWRHLTRASDGSGVSSSGVLNEPSELEWAEVPSSAPRAPTSGARLDSRSESGSSFASIVGVLLLIAMAGLSAFYVYVYGVPAYFKDQQVELASNDSHAPASRQDERQNDEQSPGMPEVASDPALDVGTDDDFLAGLAGLDEFQQLSGMCSRADSECSSDGASSESLKGKRNKQGTNESPAADQQKTRQEESSCGPDDRESAGLKPAPDAVNSRRWARGGGEQDVHVALAAVEDILMEEEEWEEAVPQSVKEDQGGLENPRQTSKQGDGDGEHQNDQRSKLVPVKEVCEHAPEHSQGNQDLESDEDLGQEGDADDEFDEWEEFGKSQEHDLSRASRAPADDTATKAEHRTLLLSQYLPERRHDDESLQENADAVQSAQESQDEDNEDIWEQPETDGWDEVQNDVAETKPASRKLDDSLSDDDLARTYAAAIANIQERNEDDEWAWGRVVESVDPENEQREEDEAIAAAKEFAATWKPQQEVWFAGPDGPRPTWLATPEGPRPLTGHLDEKLSLAAKMRKDADRFSGRTSAAVSSSSHVRVQEKNSKRESEPQPQIPEAPPSNQYVYFASPSGGGRTWYPANAAFGTQKDGSLPSDSKKSKDVGPGGGAEEDFVVGRPTRFRPTGCFVRLRGGSELFLPVEHMQPRTEAVTSTIRDRMRGIERLLVREVDEETVTMLTESEAKAKANEIDARKALMDEGIAVLRQGYDPRKWIKGSISAVQANGIYVSVVAGKDAFVPVAEMPSKFTAPGEEDPEKLRPTLQIGQLADVRVIRHSWQTDSFVASMLSYEESIARQKNSRNSSGPYSMPAAARALSADPFGNPTASSSGDRPRAQSPGPAVKKLADKGFSLVDNSTASELNAWLKQSTQDQRNKGKKTNGVVPSKSEKSFIVNVVRGMNGKVCGQLNVSTRVSEKEIKDEALALVMKQGELKAGQDHKGITIAKNIITVKL